MASKRMNQVADDIRQHVATLLVTGRISDPRVKGVTIHDVKVSPDLHLARIFYSVFGSPSEKEQVALGLKAAAGFVRRSLAEALRLRYTPEVVFTFDDTTERAARIHEVLQSVRQEWTEEPAAADDAKKPEES